MKRILIVEDEPVIALGLRDSLEAEGYSVEVAAEGVEAETRAREGGFDLILLDVMLPGRDGFTICRNLRASGCSTPVILLTAKGQEAARIKGLDLGATITSPSRFREASFWSGCAPPCAAPPSPSSSAPSSYTFGDVTIDFARHDATRAGQPLDLTPIEFKMLRALIENRGRVLPHDEIIERVWGRDAFLWTACSTRT